jgi:hypothetical protein
VNRSTLEGHFKWMLSNAESRLVGLVTFFQQQSPPPEMESAKGKKPKLRLGAGERSNPRCRRSIIN